MPELTVGPVVTPVDVEIAVRETFAETMPFYLAEIDEQHGLVRGTTKPPRLYIARNENERWDEETPPVLVVACPGTIGEPVRHGARGTYGAWYQVNIGVTVGGATEQGSRALAGRHLAALMLVIGQQPHMGGLAHDTVWLGGRTDPIAPQRTLMGAETLANVYVRHVLDTRGLIPRDLPDDPTDPAAATPTPTSVRVRTIPS